MQHPTTEIYLKKTTHTHTVHKKNDVQIKKTAKRVTDSTLPCYSAMVGKHNSMWPIKVNQSRNSAYRTENLTESRYKSKTRKTRLNYSLALPIIENPKRPNRQRNLPRNPVQPDHRFKNIPLHTAKCLRISELSRFKKFVMSQDSKNFKVGPTDRAEHPMRNLKKKKKTLSILAQKNISSCGKPCQHTSVDQVQEVKKIKMRS